MLLAVDTSNEWLGIAVYDGSRVIGEQAWRSSQHHTVELAPAFQDLLTRCSITMETLSALGIAIGPGSFTSLRVGLALFTVIHDNCSPHSISAFVISALTRQRNF